MKINLILKKAFLFPW